MMAFVVVGRMALMAGKLALKHRGTLMKLYGFKKPILDLMENVSKNISSKGDGKLTRQACLEELQRSSLPNAGDKAQEVCDFAFNVVAQAKGDSINAEELFLAAYVKSTEDDDLEVKLGKGFGLMDAEEGSVIDREQASTIFRALSGEVKVDALAEKVFKTPDQKLSKEDFVQGCLGHQDIRDSLSKVEVKGKGKKSDSAGSSKR